MCPPKALYPLLLLCVSLLAGCSRSDDSIQERLVAAVKPVDTLSPGHYKVIAMDSIAPFPWDTMYVFHGEDPARAISHRIGFEWNGPDVPNLEYRLLFVSGREVVAYTDYDHDTFPISFRWCDKSIEAFARSRARFITFRFCSPPSNPYYPMIPLDCLTSKITSTNYQNMVQRGCPVSDYKRPSS
jgi:hypothetical protein